MSIVLSDQRYEEIKRTVVDTFVKYGVTCVPVNGFEMATKMGVKVIPYSSKAKSIQKLLFKKSEDGFCVEKGDGEWLIFYNDHQDYGRVNNTLLHEIGHIVLDHSEDSELAEKEVKFFAKYALVPPVLVHKFKLGTPEQIVEVFAVSYEAAGYALEYYKKWLRHGGKLKDYEQKTLQLFREVA